MMNAILKKQQALIKRLSGDPQAKKKVNAISKLQWIETSYALDGGDLTTDEVKTVLSGQYVINKTVQDHVTIHNYAEMVNYLYDCLAIKDKVDLSLLEKANEILSKDEMRTILREPFRKTVPVVSALELVPVHPHDVRKAIEKTLQEFYAMRKELDPIMRGCYIHNEILRVYPFDGNNEATARAMLNFELLAANLPPIPFTMSMRAYNGAIVSHLKKDDPEPFYLLMRDILNERLERLLDML